jgi:BRCA1 C Terminus (BRCT) domain
LGSLLEEEQREKICQKQNIRRDDSIIFGICEGLLADNHLSVEEIDFLSQWLGANWAIQQEYPWCDLASIICDILEDGKIEESERSHLQKAIEGILGKNTEGYEKGVICLPYSKESIVFEGNSFCFTGKFEFFKRKELAEMVKSIGGVFVEKPKPVDEIRTGRAVKNPNYLVVAKTTTRDWINTSYGRKIQGVMENNKNLELMKKPPFEQTKIIHESWFFECFNKALKNETNKELGFAR